MPPIIRALACCCLLVCPPIYAQCIGWPPGAPHTSTEAVLTIKLDEPEIEVGQSALLHIQLTNATKHPLEVVETFVQRDNEIHLVDSHGAEVPLTQHGAAIRKQPIIDYRRTTVTLAPGEVLKADEDIAQIYSITRPGQYRAFVCRPVIDLGPILSNTVALRAR